jgi:hypothetical protein
LKSKRNDSDINSKILDSLNNKLESATRYVINIARGLPFRRDISEKEGQVILEIWLPTAQAGSPDRALEALKGAGKWLLWSIGCDHNSRLFNQYIGMDQDRILGRYSLNTSESALKSYKRLVDEVEIDRILDEAGIVGAYRVGYKLLYNSLWKIRDGFKGERQKAELEKVISKPSNQGLDQDLVDKISKMVFS